MNASVKTMPPRTTFNISGFDQLTKDVAVKVVRRGQLAAQRELQEILGPQWGPRTGQVYERSNGASHTASREGEAPAIDTGRLRQSAQMHSIEFEGEKVIGAVGVATPYAFRLEIGDEKRGPRPFVSRLSSERARSEKIQRIAAQVLPK